MAQAMKRLSQTKAPAFSLVELLVTLALVALLAGLGVPAIQGVRTKAHQAVCAQNLKQLGQGLLLYAGDNNGNLPGTHHGGSSYWIEELRGPLGEKYDRIRISPRDPKGAQRLSQGGTSYVMTARVNAMAYVNEFGEVDASEPVYDNLNRISTPSRVILLFLASTNKGTSPSEDHVCGDITTWPGFRSETWPDAFGGKPVGPGDQGSSNYLFADGRVQSISAAEIRRRIENGDDISKAY